MASAGAAGAAGVRIVSLEEAGAAAEAGLVPGDEVIAWRSDDGAVHPVEAPLALEIVWQTVHPRAGMTVVLRRGEQEEILERRIGPRPWGAEIEPAGTPGAGSRLDRLLALARERRSVDDVDGETWALGRALGAADEGGASGEDGDVAAWRGRLEELRSLQSPEVLVWALGHVATSHRGRGAWDEQTETLRRAVETLEAAPEVTAGEPGRRCWLGSLRHRLGGVLRELGHLPLAAEVLQRSLVDLDAGGASPYAVAGVRTTYANVLRQSGEIGEARRQVEQAVAELESVAPRSVAATDAANVAGIVAMQAGDGAMAKLHFQRSLDLARELDLAPRYRISALGNLGTVAYHSGDLDLAQERFALAQELFEATQPRGPEWARGLNNLGALAFQRGDLVAAQDYFERAVAIALEFTPDGLSGLGTMRNLSQVYAARGLLAEAIALTERLVAIAETNDVPTSELAGSWARLGGHHYDRRDFDAAERAYRRAIELDGEDALVAASLGQLAIEAGDPEGALDWFDRALALGKGDDTLRSTVATARVERAEALRRLGRLDAARDEARRGLEAAREIGDRPGEAAALARLGRIELDRGDLASARSSAAGALELRRRISPGSWAVVWSMQLVADVATALGETGRAEELACAASTEVLRLIQGVGTWETDRAPSRAAHMPIFRQCADLRAARGDATGALEAIWSARGAGLRRRIAERVVVAESALDPQVRSRLVQNRARLERALEARRAAAEDPAAEADERIAELRRERRSLIEASVERAPVLAGLHAAAPAPTPETLATALAGEALLLTYVVGEDRSWLLTLDASGAAGAHALDAGERRLGELVTELRELIARRAPLAELDPVAEELGGLLLGPLGARAKLPPLVVGADGPLHELPFAALVVGHGRRYLAEQTSVRFLLTGDGPDPADEPAWSDRSRLVAFADPVPISSGDQPGGAPGARSVPAPLPGARREARRIASMFEGSLVRTGSAATVEALMADAPGADVLHLAAHADVDARDPSINALLLASGGGGPGRLEAWRIAEELELRAGLVTLAACETAVGADVDGEGLLGLMRTFRLAGAKRVVASLWAVDDRATETLMVEFYRGLAAGRSVGEALTRAQRTVLGGEAEVVSSGATTRGVGGLRSAGGEGLRHPYDWAGFQLYF